MESSRSAAQGAGIRSTLPWLLALGGAATALAALSYGTRDADSRLYAEIGAQLAGRPVQEWIAPRFPPGWYMSGLFREHPVGIHLLPALMGRLGYPALQAAYLANALYQVLSIVVLCRLAGLLVSSVPSRALGLAVQLIPIAFTFRIRANHEQALLLCLLLALLAAERARRRPAYAVGMAAALVALLLVKGVFVVFGLLACGLWIAVRGRADEGSAKIGFRGLALALGAVGAAAWLYEVLYRGATGEPFWTFNLSRQLGVAAASSSPSPVLEKAYNVAWYTARVVWFAFPWSVVLVAGAVFGRGRAGPLWTAEASGTPAPAPGPSGPRDGLVFALLLTASFIAAFSLSDRRADRYIFPAYFAVAAAGTILGLRVWPRLHSAAQRLDRWHPWPTVGLWTFTFGLHILGGWLGLPTVKVWAPDR